MRHGAQALSRLIAFRAPGLPASFQSLTPTRLWAGIFAFWVLLISGFVGTPGIVQMVRLKSLLGAKQGQLRLLQEDVKKLQLEAIDLDHNHTVQTREIRRVLGYAAPDEIIFDFGTAERI